MLRMLVATLALLAASACSYGSAVDMAPMSARSATPVIRPGDYCEAKGARAGGLFTVVSSQDCVPITWDEATRSYTMIDKDDKTIAAVVPLGNDLILAQIETADEDRSHAPDKYQIQLLLAHGNAFAVLPALDDKPLAEVARKHPEINFGTTQSSSMKARNTGAPPDDPDMGRVYIAAGKPEDIKGFLRDAARETMRLAKAEGKTKEEVSVGVRDNSGKPDHKASRAQAADIQAVLKALDALGK